MIAMDVLEFLWRVPLRVLFVAVLAVLAYVCMRAISKLFKAYQEIFVMWTIAFGHSWISQSKNMRIHIYFCRTDKMDDYSMEECLRFLLTGYETISLHHSSPELHQVYRKYLLSHSHAFLCRDRQDGSLRGMLLIDINHKEMHTVVKLGAALFQSHYRGGPWMKLLEGTLAIKELILHPFTPIYSVSKISTYKSYIVAQLHRECYPHYAKEAPEIYKKIAEEFVGTAGLKDEGYNRDTFVLKHRVSKLKQYIAPISDRDLRNPHIKFFNERNADWRKGDQLVTVWRVSWIDLWDVLVVMVKQILYAGKGTGGPRGIGGAGNISARRAQKIQARRLQRGLTFQDAEATILAVQYSLYEYGDEEGIDVPELSSSVCTPRTPKSPEALVELDVNYQL